MMANVRGVTVFFLLDDRWMCLLEDDLVIFSLAYVIFLEAMNREVDDRFKIMFWWSYFQG